MSKTRRVRSTLATIVCCFSYTVQAVADGPKRVDIPAGGLVAALETLSRQTAIDLVFQPDQLRSFRTEGVSGTYSPQDAIRILLKGTSLELRTDASSGAMVIAPSSAPKTSALAPEVAGTRFELAQSAPVTPSQAQGDRQEGVAAAGSEQGAQSPTVIELEETLVTGTRIRGVRNETSPIIRLDRTAIEDTGYSSTQDLFDSLPQNFGGGPLGASEDGVLGEGASAATNFTAATGVNLRGLGSNSTLVLLNGRRMAPSQFGQTVDVSILPLSLIGGVDVLTDGASALYGSDAVAGVVNIVLRDDFEGAETTMRYGDSSDGGRAERTASQVLGESWGGGSILAGVQYQDLESLQSDQRSFTSGRPMPTDLLPKTRTISGVLSLEQKLSSNIEAFTQVLYSTKDIARRNTLTTSQDRVASETENISLSAGSIVELPAAWRLTGTLNLGRDTGTMYQRTHYPLASLTNITEQENTFDSRGVELVFDGPTVDLPAGAAGVALGASYRKDDFHQDAFINSVRRFDRDAGVEVSALFGELNVPIVGAANALPGMRALDVALAVRLDSYDRYGDTTNPRIGILYEPVEDLRLRASYSESFRAPNAMEQFTSTNTLYVLTRAMGDPNGSGSVPAINIQGSRALMPETATSFAWGFDWDPQSLKGLSVSFTHYGIEYKNRIWTPGTNNNALRLPDVYGALIYTLPDDAAAQSLINEIVSQGGVYSDLIGSGAAGVRYVYDQRTLNAASVDQTGVDLTLAQRLDLASGGLTLRLNATYIENIDTQLVTGAADADYVDRYGYPADLRFRADASWTNTRWSLSAGLNFVDAYEDLTQTTPRDVKSWTTIDLSARLRIGDLIGHDLEKAQLTLAAQNVFNEDPPWIVSHNVTAVNYDPANAAPLGRFIAAEFRYIW